MNSKRCNALKRKLDLASQNYEALYNHMLELTEDLKKMELENEYKSAFISYHGLYNDYVYFRNNAHRVQYENEPFESFSLD